MRIETCRFRRIKDGEWEYGIIIDEGNGPLIDADGKVVPSDPQIWDWRRDNQNIMTVFE